MNTIVEIEKELSVRRDILLSSSISFHNSNALVKFQEDNDCHGLLKSGFFRHLYKTYRFSAITQLAKLLNTSKRERYTFSNFLVKSRKGSATYSTHLQHITEHNPKLTEAALQTTIIGFHDNFVKKNQLSIKKVLDQRNTIYAHTTGKVAPGIPDEELSKLLGNTQSFFNQIYGVLFGSSFLFSSVNDWSINSTLNEIEYARKTMGALHLAQLQKFDESEDGIKVAFGDDEVLIGSLKDQLQNIRSLL